MQQKHFNSHKNLQKYEKLSEDEFKNISIRTLRENIKMFPIKKQTFRAKEINTDYSIDINDNYQILNVKRRCCIIL